ncbi:DUF805 domain-containing protein [Phenylobacterium deserti]|uniref:DUF805 domain-containing protein n=1 Tax=Phenylobacterium deserti TaxID=1914756 RepID=UPI001401E773|nr:DUF805 domain-containing protein [Phenylobacterium deserti]
MRTIFFGDRETIGRGEYAVTGLLMSAFLLLDAILFFLPLSFLSGSPLGQTIIRGIQLGAVLFVLLYCITGFVVASVRRLRDIGQSGFWAFLLLAPGISWLLFWFVLSLIPGRRDEDDPTAAPSQPSQPAPGVL